MKCISLVVEVIAAGGLTASHVYVVSESATFDELIIWAFDRRGGEAVGEFGVDTMGA